MNRYSDIEYILKMPIHVGYKLILKAFRREKEKQVFDVWNVEHVYWSENNFISLKEYIDQALGSTEFNKENNNKEKSKQILNKAKIISNNFKMNKQIYKNINIKEV